VLGTGGGGVGAWTHEAARHAAGKFPRRGATRLRCGVLFVKKKPFDRTETLVRADRARARGRHRKAIAAYRQILAVHPDDLTVHGKIAPLLAARGERVPALASFRRATDGHLKAGFVDRALAVLSQAAEHFPEEEPLWTEMAQLHVKRGRRADAVASLVRGGDRLLRHRRLATSEKVLRLALGLEPYQPDASVLLARTVARAGRKPEALALLDGLSARLRGKRLSSVRRLAFRLSPTPRNLWRWLRAAFSGR
jgi:tetratricopeptide (TPR) repeat protein